MRTLPDWAVEVIRMNQRIAERPRASSGHNVNPWDLWLDGAEHRVEVPPGRLAHGFACCMQSVAGRQGVHLEVHIDGNTLHIQARPREGN